MTPVVLASARAPRSRRAARAQRLAPRRWRRQQAQRRSPRVGVVRARVAAPGRRRLGVHRSVVARSRARGAAVPRRTRAQWCAPLECCACRARAARDDAPTTLPSPRPPPLLRERLSGARPPPQGSRQANARVVAKDNGARARRRRRQAEAEAAEAEAEAAEAEAEAAGPDDEEEAGPSSSQPPPSKPQRKAAAPPAAGCVRLPLRHLRLHSRRPPPRTAQVRARGDAPRSPGPRARAASRRNPSPPAEAATAPAPAVAALPRLRRRRTRATTRQTQRSNSTTTLLAVRRPGGRRARSRCGVARTSSATACT